MSTTHDHLGDLEALAREGWRFRMRRNGTLGFVATAKRGDNAITVTARAMEDAVTELVRYVESVTL